MCKNIITYVTVAAIFFSKFFFFVCVQTLFCLNLSSSLQMISVSASCWPCLHEATQRTWSRSFSDIESLTSLTFLHFSILSFQPLLFIQLFLFNFSPASQSVVLSVKYCSTSFPFSRSNFTSTNENMAQTQAFHTDVTLPQSDSTLLPLSQILNSAATCPARGNEFFFLSDHAGEKRRPGRDLKVQCFL